MSDSDAISENVTYRELASALAEKSAEVARQTDEYREIVRRDPDFAQARWWLIREQAKRDTLAECIGKLHRFHTNDGECDPLGFANWLWDEHKFTNEQRSKTTGTLAESWHGSHKATSLALDAVTETTDVEYEDYGELEMGEVA